MRLISASVDLWLKGSGRSKGCTTRISTHSPQWPRQPGYVWQRRLRTESCAIFDAKQAFLNVNIDEETFIKILEE